MFLIGSVRIFLCGLEMLLSSSLSFIGEWGIVCCTDLDEGRKERLVIEVSNLRANVMK